MQYMGGKALKADDILAVILPNRVPGQWFVEPFCGGCNITAKVDGPRIANDIHFYLIQMWERVVYHGWIPPKEVSRELYTDIKNNPNNYEPWLVGFVGFCSFGGKWFNGYPDHKRGDDFFLRAFNSAIKQSEAMRGVLFFNTDYKSLLVPSTSLIYCDPPYKGTTGYGIDFDHGTFWQWCRDKASEGHKVFISELSAPEDFKAIWGKARKNVLANGVIKNMSHCEFLYIHESQTGIIKYQLDLFND